MAFGRGRRVEWYSILYFQGPGEPSFQRSDFTPHLSREGGEIRFESIEQAVEGLKRTPMYLRDPEKALRKFAVIRTRGEIVYRTPVGTFKRLVKDEDRYYAWYEVTYFEDERSFDHGYQGVELYRGQPAAYRTFSDAFGGMLELFERTGIADEEKPHFNIVWYQSEMENPRELALIARETP